MEDETNIDKESQETKLSRRQILKIGLWSGLSGAAVSTVGGRYTNELLNIAEDLTGFSPDRSLGELFQSFSLRTLPDLSVGNFNLAAQLKGKSDKPSAYVRRAGTGVSGAICSAFPSFEPEVCKDYRSEAFIKTTDAILLGGPFSNPDTAAYLGYDLSAQDRLFPGLPSPRAKDDFSLPFEFLNGETTRGEFDGAVEKAVRFDGGVQVERPMWRIRDRRNGNVIRCEKDGDWLASEYLQIIRVIDRAGNVKIFAWGLHGHSLSGFFWPGEIIKSNLEELIERTDGLDQFHALLPVSLDRATAIDGPYMKATVDWRSVDRNRYIVDLSSSFGTREKPRLRTHSQ
ncbi:hypothetical protein GYB14_18530 [bacterium]|nr:hypothetical protein [bacterium]